MARYDYSFVQEQHTQAAAPLHSAVRAGETMGPTPNASAQNFP